MHILDVRSYRDFSMALDRTYRWRHGLVAIMGMISDTTAMTDNSCSMCSVQFSE